MLFQMGAQVLVVPVFLHAWGGSVYGYWLAIVAAKGLLTIVALAYHDYLGFECLQLRDDDRAERGALLSDALPMAALVGLTILGGTTLLLALPLSDHLFELSTSDPVLRDGFRFSLWIQIALWVVTTNILGVLERVMVSLGHFARCTWWSLATNALSALVPALAAALGATLLGATVAYVAASVVLAVTNYLSFVRLLRAHGIGVRRPDLRSGLHHFGRSLGVAFATGVEYMQQTGFRLLLLPFLGAAPLASFATHRTVANVAQQGIGTLIAPSQPELMRIVARRDGPRFTGIVAFMSVVVTGLICPAFVVLQTVINRIFALWTVGSIPYDAVTFALLSGSVLVYGLAQPSRAIVRGNNLVRGQMTISSIAAVILGLGAWYAIPVHGIQGASGALLVAEVVRAVLFAGFARQWCARAGLPGFLTPLLWSTLNVVVTAATVLAMAALPTLQLPLLAGYLLVWALLHLMLWRTMPADVRAIVAGGIARLVPDRRER
jgi:O-antigen/teichoic acid export membrane protein